MTDWIGYLASVLIAISITTKGGLIFRIFNLSGSIVFFVYGMLIDSLPVAFINVYSAGINTFHLIKLIREARKKRGQKTEQLL